MPRPKGSKNKPKVAEVPEVKFNQKADVMPALKMNQSPPAWTPAPDMGNIKPPADSEKACVHCEHKAGMHYGSAKNWCNSTGCRCQEFK